MPQLRRSIITGEWVVIAPERLRRPDDYVSAATVRSDAKLKCVFCVDKRVYNEERIKGFETKHIYVAPNKFPAFIENEKHISPRTYKVEENFFHVRPSTGGHDVIVIKEHNLDLPKFPMPVWEELFKMFRRRYEYFDKSLGVEYAMAIYNHLRPAGASIEHPHAQLFASNIIPNYVAKELHSAERYFERNGQCVFCALIKHELSEKIRILYYDRNFIAFTFYAARFPFEIWIFPVKHQSRFEDVTNKDIGYLAKCLQNVFGKLDSTLNDPPLNFFIHNLPNIARQADYYHWHIEIIPRLGQYGGYELGSGVVIDVVSPEKAAEFLKKKK